MSDGSDEGIAAAYDARAAEYVEVAGALEQMDAEDAAVIAAWRDATPGLLLDAGCGPGQWTGFLTRGGRAAQGIDLAPEFIAVAKERHPGIRFDVGSFRALPFDSERGRSRARRPGEASSRPHGSLIAHRR